MRGNGTGVWPMQHMLHFVLGSAIVSRRILRRARDDVKKHFAKVKVNSKGVLKCSTHGKSAIKNPMERRCGSVRYGKLVAEYEKWQKVSAELSVLFTGRRVAVSVSTVQQKILHGLGKAYTKTTKYAVTRFARALIYAFDCQFADTSEDWEEYRSMSDHVATVVRRWGVGEYDVALAVRNALRTRLQNELYSLADLICFLCLAEAIEED